MKKVLYITLLIATLLLCGNVRAAELTNVSYNGNFKVEGTGTGQIQIVIFDSNDSPVYMTTTEASEGTFSITLPKIDGLKTGEYKIKVADYDGSQADTQTLKIKVNSTTQNPYTYDGIYVYLFISFLGVLGLIKGVSLLRKNYATSTK